MLNSADELTIKDIEEFLNGEGAGTQPVEKEKETPPEAQLQNEDTTEAFAHRLAKATNKLRIEERENIAKSMGYESFEEMKKEKEKELIKSKDLDPEIVTPVVEQLIEKRLAEDPRLKELDEFKQEKIQKWTEKELGEISKLTNGKITRLDQLPKNVIDLWKQRGSLKEAYLVLEGETLIKQIQTNIISEQSKGSTAHLKTLEATPIVETLKDKRLMTEKEKSVYKLFNPKITDEDLNKKLIDK